MTSTEVPAGGIWGRNVLLVVTVLTATGMLGSWVDFVGAVPAGNLSMTPGCGAGFLILLVFAFVLAVLLVLAVIGALASVGMLFLWHGSGWGPILMVVANLLTMAFYGWWQPVFPGEIGWAIAILVLAAMPAVATAILLVLVLSRGRAWIRVGELVIIGLVAVPCIWLYSSGLASDLATGAQAAPPAVTSSSGASSGPRC